MVSRRQLFVPGLFFWIIILGTITTLIVVRYENSISELIHQKGVERARHPM